MKIQYNHTKLIIQLIVVSLIFTTATFSINTELGSNSVVHAKSKNKVPKSYLQTDKKWAKKPYGNDTTVGEMGCGPTALAMALYTLGNKKVTPLTACRWSAKNGTKTKKPGRTKDRFFIEYAKKYNVKVTRLNKGNLKKKSKAYRKKINKKALQAVNDGNWVIALMTDGNWAQRGHFILWYDVSGKNALIRDPISKKPKRVKNKYKLLQKETIRYFVVEVKKPENTQSS